MSGALPNPSSASGGYLQPIGNQQAQDDALVDVLTGMVCGITGLNANYVRPRWQPTPPTQPPATVDWCAIGVTSIERTDYPVITHYGIANSGYGEDTVSRQETLRVLASFYGPNCEGNASMLRDGLVLPQNKEAIQAQGIVFVDVDTTVHLPDLTNLQFISRCDLPMRFRRQVDRNYAILNIIQVVGALESNDGATDSILVNSPTGE